MIIICTKIITGKSNVLFIDKSAVVISNGIILAIGTQDHIIKKFPGHRVYRFQNAVLLPGLINLHTHLELPPLLDTIRAEIFPDWVLNLVETTRSLCNNNYECASRTNINTLIASGTTTVGEICTHNVSRALLSRSGLRARIFDEIISMEAEKNSRSTVQHSRGSNSGRIHTGLSPHTPYTVSESILHSLSQLAQKKNIRLAMHVAESKDEIKLLQQKKNRLEKLYQFANWSLSWAPKADSPFEYLHQLGILSPRFLAVHAVQVTDNDIKLIKKFKVSIAHCPRSNKELGVGRMPLKKFLDSGITVGLGTDSLASSPSLNMWDEMRYAYKIHKKDGITVQDIFHLATMGGAKAMGMGKEIGTLEPGKRADIIAVLLPKKNTGDIYSDLLRETKSCIMTMVDGKVLFRN